MELGDGGIPPHTELKLTHVEVDVDGLTDFRSLLGRELDTNLKPGVQGITHDHSMGVGFGLRNVGNQVQAARRTYHESLRTSTANLAEYVETAEILIDAIHRVATKYGETDLSSAANSARVTAELAAAFNDAQAAKIVERERETLRELNRLRLGTEQ